VAIMEQRRQMELQRKREQLGINGAQAAGVFDSGPPAELELVAQRDAWLREQYESANRVIDYTSVPILPDDGVESEVVRVARLNRPAGPAVPAVEEEGL